MPLTDNDVGAVQVATAVSLDDSPGLTIKAAAGLLYGWHVKNTTAGALYVQIFDALIANVTLGTTAPKIILGIAGNVHASDQLSKPVVFGTGICAFSTTAANNNTAAVSDATFFYA